MLVTQATASPTRKTSYGLAGGTLVTLLIALGDYVGFAVEPGLASAVATLVGFGFAWLSRSRAERPD